MKQFPRLHSYPAMPCNVKKSNRSRRLFLLISIRSITMRILQYLSKEFDANDADKANWYRTWIYKGFDALEARLSEDVFCVERSTDFGRYLPCPSSL